MSRHNRRRRRSRQHRHTNLLADAYALETSYDDSSSVVSWPSAGLRVPNSPSNAYVRFESPSPAVKATSVIYTLSATNRTRSECRESISGANCQSKVSSGDYSFFWDPTPGQNPWTMQPSTTQKSSPNHLCEYLYSRKKTFPPGLGQRTAEFPLPVAPGYKPLQRTILLDKKDEIMLPHGEHCDSLCNTMTSVIKSLFHGEMDYNDEEIDEAQAKKKAEYRDVQIAQSQAAQRRIAERRAQPHMLLSRQYEHLNRQPIHHRYLGQAKQMAEQQSPNPTQWLLQRSFWTADVFT